MNSKLWAGIASAVDGLSQAELVRAADAVVKDAILEAGTRVSAAALRDALQNRQTLKGKFRRVPGLSDSRAVENPSLRDDFRKTSWPNLTNLARGPSRTS